MAYRIRQGRHFNVPKPGLDYTQTFLYLLDHLGEEVRLAPYIPIAPSLESDDSLSFGIQDYKPNPVIAKALDTLFVLHADHEMVS